ncbi:aspartyl-phosphate phosphatase Spo0E family protein [Pontibacillus halophilus]|uniref:aspartyl-phosphate phosphatase Spo0E family protein n=1 Tax=Pontibacillus halophilus TaxID=516704 RepID=UPI0004240CEA|nr:aspartyl-phosphate phosphatase Spo0E family protein [Pontibacillus halophilus]
MIRERSISVHPHLEEQIKQKREEMIAVAMKEGIHSMNTLHISQDLDQLLNEQQWMRNQVITLK